MNKETIERKNKEIIDAIHVSKMCDSEGFSVFSKYLDDKIKEIRFQDVIGIKSLEVLSVAQGMAIAFEDIKQYFSDRKHQALMPMIDPDTGEEEILNNKK